MDYLLFGYWLFSWLRILLFFLAWCVFHPVDTVKYFLGLPYNRQQSAFSSRSTSDDVINCILSKDASFFSNKVIFLTGVTDGVGRQLLLSLFRANFGIQNVDNRLKRIIVSYRDEHKFLLLKQRCLDICNNLPTSSPRSNDTNNSTDSVAARFSMQDVDALLFGAECDLSNLMSVDRFVSDVTNYCQTSDVPHLHYILLNAGILIKYHRFTNQRFEWHFGVNYVSHFYLMMRLRPLILPKSWQLSDANSNDEDEKECPDEDTKMQVVERSVVTAPGAKKVDVTNVGQDCKVTVVGSIASMCAVYPNGIDFENVDFEKYYHNVVAYGQSKLACMLYALELSKKFAKEIENRKYELLDTIETFDHYDRDNNEVFTNSLMDLINDEIEMEQEKQDLNSSNLSVADAAETIIRDKISKYLDSRILPSISVNTVHPGVILESSLYREYCRDSTIVRMMIDSVIARIVFKTCKQGAGALAYAMFCANDAKFVCDCVEYPLPQPSAFPNAKLQRKLWKETIRWIQSRHCD